MHFRWALIDPHQPKSGPQGQPLLNAFFCALLFMWSILPLPAGIPPVVRLLGVDVPVQNFMASFAMGSIASSALSPPLAPDKPFDNVGFRKCGWLERYGTAIVAWVQGRIWAAKGTTAQFVLFFVPLFGLRALGFSEAHTLIATTLVAYAVLDTGKRINVALVLQSERHLIAMTRLSRLGFLAWVSLAYFYLETPLNHPFTVGTFCAAVLVGFLVRR